ncbi:dimethylarginine dimethylaminohydrolase family protein [Gryllotalpicola reticulitermitis]|uniref:Dimethylarginine dimethylaminohydrolase family protein n=1 Tax=Gryllotalpicola reticulitermitis TaxID=1184153 RepID=A0ABV8Q5E9_9MICO
MTIPWSRRLTASFLAALATALVAFGTTELAMYMVNSLSLQAISSYALYFGIPALVLLIVVLLAGLIDSFSSWWVALLASLVGGLLGAAVGGLVTAQGQLVKYLDQVVGFYLFFIVASTVTGALLGRRVWKLWIARPASRGRVVFVRVPASNLAEGLVTHIPRTLVDRDLADKQWDDYVAAFAGSGWQTVEVAPADRLADSVFVEDTAVVLSRSVAVLTRPGAESRRAEVAAVGDKLREQGLTLYELEAPGTLDGGDVVRVGDTLYVGRSERTDADGIRQLREVIAMAGLDLAVVAVPLQGGLHLGTSAAALPDGTVLYSSPEIDPSLFGRSIRVPVGNSANIVALDEKTVLVPASSPGTAELVADLGYTVVKVDLSEFEKIEGSAGCLSIRL